jgi:hypothetical protein
MRGRRVSPPRQTELNRYETLSDPRNVTGSYSSRIVDQDYPIIGSYSSNKLTPRRALPSVNGPVGAELNKYESVSDPFNITGSYSSEPLNQYYPAIGSYSSKNYFPRYSDGDDEDAVFNPNTFVTHMNQFEQKILKARQEGPLAVENANIHLNDKISKLKAKLADDSKLNRPEDRELVSSYIDRLSGLLSMGSPKNHQGGRISPRRRSPSPRLGRSSPPRDARGRFTSKPNH